VGNSYSLKLKEGYAAIGIIGMFWWFYWSGWYLRPQGPQPLKALLPLGLPIIHVCVEWPAVLYSEEFVLLYIKFGVTGSDLNVQHTRGNTAGMFKMH
jgi:hypothetical protein